ncbi:lysophospholipid acyltransferase family protein [Robertmurraya sp. DFI.2.37]|uniref:lysophospholipid acyltransferase family protein n=1 Tax=Robertmurraya sp. DFI.2.37 TaxID=3031819 RepID=UPI0012493095|nr:lysophospholipid acyltransferase family protein [Robertmurraya sp. DFI.2.37]MDF1511476.1 lysophospholipid acyltransferase family protein [Robertmurraya sp. DFI.2.37]
MYYFVANIIKFFLRLRGKIAVYNKQYLPKQGPYVIACTHTGWVDIFYLGIALLPSKIHYMAKKQLFEKRMLGWLLKKLNAFPVDRDNPGPSVLKVPKRLLSNGEIVGIFPSGTRTNEQIALKQGAITIAQRSEVPIIPVVYNGPNNFKELFTRRKAHLIFGEPIYLISKEKDSRTYYTGVLEQKLAELESHLLTRLK